MGRLMSRLMCRLFRRLVIRLRSRLMSRRSNKSQMSKLKVRVNYGGAVRIVEIERRNPSFAALRNGAQKKYKLQNANDLQFHFQVPGGVKIAVKTDEELKRAIAESVRVRATYVEIEIPGRPPAHVTPSANQPAAQPNYQPPKQQAHQPSHQPPAQHQQPAHQQPAHKDAAPAASGDSVLSFSLPGSGSGDKVKVAATPESNRYLFVPTPCAHATRIEIQIATGGKALQFVMSSNVAKLTQTFNLPFEISPSDLVLEGHTVVLKFPF